MSCCAKRIGIGVRNRSHRFIDRIVHRFPDNTNFHRANWLDRTIEEIWQTRHVFVITTSHDTHHQSRIFGGVRKAPHSIGATSHSHYTIPTCRPISWLYAIYTVETGRLTNRTASVRSKRKGHNIERRYDRRATRRTASYSSGIDGIVRWTKCRIFR